MISSTFGAPSGGTIRGGHQVFDSLVVSPITPPKFGGGAGSCLPSIVVVALGEPGVPVTCWAKAGDAASVSRNQVETVRMPVLIIIFLPKFGRTRQIGLHQAPEKVCALWRSQLHRQLVDLAGEGEK